MLLIFVQIAIFRAQISRNINHRGCVTLSIFEVRKTSNYFIPLQPERARRNGRKISSSVTKVETRICVCVCESEDLLFNRTYLAAHT